MKKLPKKLIVYRDVENADDEVLLCCKKPDEIAVIGEKIAAAIYVLEKNIVVEGVVTVSMKK